MENWIFISILGVILGAASSDTIVYPGKSALLSYSPARGEFPVESLFGRGFFSYIDNHGISRTVTLEPNPLLGVRVSNDGKLATDLSTQQKDDRLRPIKEFDERPFQDNVMELDKDMSLTSALNSGSLKGTEQSNVDQKLNQQILSVSIPNQQEQILLYPNIETVPAQGLGPRPDGNTYWTSQNTPLTFSSLPKPTVLRQGVFSSENPFLNQQLGIQNPSTVDSNLAPIQQNNPLPLTGQVFFYSSAGSINSGSIPIASGPGPQESAGQFLISPLKPITSGAVVPSSGDLPEINSTTDSSSRQAFSSQDILLAPSKLPSVNSDSSQDVLEQIFANPQAVSSPPSSQLPAINPMITSQQGQNQVLEQVASYPTIPISSVVSTPSQPSFPGFAPRPQETNSHLAVPLASNIPISGVIPGNLFLPPASRFPSVPPVFMIQPQNPFLSLNKEKPLSWSKPIVPTTSAPLFNPNQNNPFLSNSLNSEATTSTNQPIAVQLSPQLEAVPPAAAAAVACDYLSVGPIAEQTKDTPEVEKAKREHFLAHELALEQLAQARQNNDNNNHQANESSLKSSADLAFVSDGNSPFESFDQPVASGQTSPSVNNNVDAESQIATLQALPVVK